MKQRFPFVVGLICVPVAFAMAAPPRFNGIGEPLDDVQTGAISAAPAPRAKGKAGKKVAPATSKATSASASAGKSTMASENTAASMGSRSASVPPKKSKKSWWWRLFHKDKDKHAKEMTQKPDGELVNTDTRYQDVNDLSQTADIHRIKPGYNGRWRVRASKVMCRMQQQLPSYGYVEFRQGVDQPLEFALYVDNPPAGSGIVRVSAQPPLWRHYSKTKDLGRLALDMSDRAVTASSAWSRRLILELSEGMQPVLRLWDAADASDDMEIFVSAIRFQESLQQFHHCLRQLLHYDVKKIQRDVLHFNPDSSKIRSQTYQKLNEILEAAKADKEIKEFNLEIYTHREGLQRYNFRLATRRAQAVRDYLIKHGISENKIFIKIYTKRKSQLAKLGYRDSDLYIALQRKQAK
jgi:outer membrane protein OmpA-like peptidoglycan-associated protein